MNNNTCRILLVDDDAATNLVHQIAIKKANINAIIDVATDGEKAIELLHSLREGEGMPNLIFLDINMPGWDGWEFLAEYSKLAHRNKEQTVIVMLTTSMNPDDEARAYKNPSVKQYLNKPLTTGKFQELIRDHVY